MEPDPWLTRLQDEGRTRRFRRGERLMLQGFERGKVLVIHRGSLRVLATTFEGDEVTLALCGPGDVVGSHSALGGGPVAAGVVAIEDGSATVLTAGRYLEIMASMPEMMLGEIRNLISMLHNAEARLIDIATEDVPERVRRHLARLCRAHEPPVALPLTQDDLASMVGAGRASIGPVLSDLRADGAISTSRGQIVVEDIDALGARPESV